MHEFMYNNDPQDLQCRNVRLLEHGVIGEENIPEKGPFYRSL